MRKITLLFICLVFCFAVSAQVLTQGFDTAGLPAGWTQTQLSATPTWVSGAANNQNNTVQPRTGAGMAYFYSGNYNEDIARLESPSLDLTTLTSARLSFYYTQLDWGGDQDVLSIYYKTSAGGTWTLIDSYTESVGAWTEVSIILPNASSDYYIGFEGYSGYGRGITVDDVVVAEAPSCTQAVVSSTVVSDCSNSQFSIDVDVATVGDATEITDGTDTWAINGVGVVSVGPYASGTSVTLTVTHSDSDCDLSLGSFIFNCPPSNISCATATSIACEDTLSGSTVGSTGLPENIGCTLGNNGVWYTFLGTGGDITVSSTAVFDHEMGVAIGDCDSLTNLACRDAALSNGTETFTIPLSTLNATYYVYIAHYASANTTTGTYTITLTCEEPPTCTQAVVASSTIVPDCENSEFNVEVDITTVGDAVEISNGTISFPVTGTGVVSVGPFAFGEAQTLTLVHSDTVCNLTLGSFNFAACPPANDLLANAIAVACGDDIQGSTIGATQDEPNASSTATVETDTSADNDSPWVWYSYTGSGTAEEITLSTCGATQTDFDTELFVYTGTSGNLTLIDDGYDECGGSSENYAAETTFMSDGSTTYYIAVGGFNVSNVGNFHLAVNCVVLSTDEFESKSLFTYFPNPVKNILTLNAQSNIQNISIYNMLGQEVLKTAPNSLDEVVDMTSLQTGAYFVKVTINDATETIRVIKQ